MKTLIFWENPAPSLFSFHRPCQVSEKNNEQILRKMCCKRTDELTDERTDGRTNRTEFIGPSPINRGSKKT